MFYKAGLLLFAGRKTLLQKFSELTNWQRTRWGTSSTWKTMLLCINILSNLLRKVSSLFQDILSMKVSDYACLPKTIEISSLLKADVRSTRLILDLSNFFTMKVSQSFIPKSSNVMYVVACFLESFAYGVIWKLFMATVGLRQNQNNSHTIRWRRTPNDHYIVHSLLLWWTWRSHGNGINMKWSLFYTLTEKYGQDWRSLVTHKLLTASLLYAYLFQKLSSSFEVVIHAPLSWLVRWTIKFTCIVHHCFSRLITFLVDDWR